MFEFNVLGPMQVRRAGQPVVLKAAMVRRLLAVLLRQPGRSVSVRRLIDELWPGGPPPTARKTLQVYVHRLRLALGDDQVVRHGPAGYLVDVAAENVDALRFEVLVQQGQSALVDRADRSAAEAMFAAALDLWGGEPYADVPGVEVLAEHAAYLTERRLLAEEAMAGIRLDTGRYVEILAAVPGLAQAFPFRERLRAYQMVALCRMGRPAEALEVYRQTAARFVAELGAEPGHLLRQVHLAVLRDDPAIGRLSSVELDGGHGPAARAALGSPPPAGSAGHPPPPPRQLPADVRGFTGRDDVLAELDGMLSPSDPGPLVVVVTGVAGVGKTALAVRWAHRVAARFPDGQLYVDLRGFDPRSAPTSASSALGQLLQGLGVEAQQIPYGVAERAAAFRSRTAGRRLLVVLDNAASPEQVRPLLPGASTTAVLVTSRERLTGLVVRDGARPVAVGGLTAEASATLIATVVGRHRAEAESAAVAEVAARCGHLPLALRIAAGHLAASPDGSIATAARLLRGGDRLAALAVAGDEQSSVAAAFRLSYRALPKRAQAVFALIGRQPGTMIDGYAAAAVSGLNVDEVTGVLDRLVEAHMVEPVGRGKYRMHDLMREYAVTVADDPGSTDAAVGRLLDYLLYVAAAGHATISATDRRYGQAVGVVPTETPDVGTQPAALAWLDEHRDTLVAAVGLAVTTGRREHAWQLAMCLWRYFHLAGHTDEWIATCSTALSAFGDEPDAGKAAVLNSLGNAQVKAGRYLEALDIHRACLAIRLQLDGPIQLAGSYGNLAIVYERLGRYPEALRCLEQVNDLVRGHPVLEGRNLNNMANIEMRLGRAAQARDKLLRHVHVAEQTGALLDTATGYNNLGRANHLLGRLDEAMYCFDRALTAAHQLRDRYSEGLILTDRANLLRDLGQYDEALTAHARALQLIQAAGQPGNLCLALNDLADTCSAVGHHERARASYDEALELAQRVGEPLHEARALAGLAALDEHSDPARARHRRARARALFASLGGPETGKPDRSA
jgi:DNA-binding SARP family transcriptional activator/tetratricopeptide (TPR) repeat protein